MSWRFRQSFKILPGLKLNLSKGGLSASVGGAPFTMNLGRRGLYATASIPGTGIQFRQRLSGESHPNSQSGLYEPPRSPLSSNYPDSPPSSLPPLDSSSAPLREIRSASTELLTSESLKELKNLIQTAYEEHEEITIVPATRKLLEDGISLYRYRRDKDWLLTDCISFVVMEDEQIADALTGDKHFEQAGFNALLK